jgi:histidine triad (HIT) family protein
MASIFTKIIQREIPAHIIAEDEKFIAFLDVFPLAKGHCLVVPKEETDYLFDLDDDTTAGIHVFAKRVAKAIKKVIPCKRIGVAVLGLEVPHAHIHLIPINQLSDINFGREKLKLEPAEMKDIAEKISKELK